MGVKAVLGNPAVRPYELLRDYIGRQINRYTGDEYKFWQGHLNKLREFNTESITPHRYLLLVRIGDEALDYRQVVEECRGAKQVVNEGGNHGFGNFACYLDNELEFCGDSSDSCHARQ